MGKTQYYTATSLDGYIAAPNHSLDWLMQFSDEPTDDYPDFIANVGALAMGSSTYEWLLRHHVMPEDGPPKPWPYEVPAWIFTTRSLPGVTGADIRFVNGDVAPVHAEMVEAANGKNVWIVGGGDLAGQFYDRGLLDEMIVAIASVTLGGGAPLFPRALISPPMRLLSVRAIGTAFAQLHYALPEIARSGES